VGRVTAEDRFREALANQLLRAQVAIGDATEQGGLANQLGDSEMEVRKVRALAFMESLMRLMEADSSA
jgi:hypothetical protein